MIRCERCGEPCKSNAKRFCSLNCRDLIRREKQMRPCLQCGKDFYRNPAHQKRGQFCGRECFGKSEQGDGHHNWRGGDVQKNCTECGKEFSVKQSDADIQRCSTKCFAQYLSRTKSHNIKHACNECNAPMTITARKVGKRNFCSRKCSDAAHSKFVKGSGNGRYVHGKHELPYPAGWTKTLKKTIRNRDGNKCKLCSMTREEQGKELPVHHIDYEKSNLNHENLITLCRFCHGKMHGGSQERTIWKKNLSSLLRSNLSGVLPVDARSTTSTPDQTITILPPEF